MYIVHVGPSNNTRDDFTKLDLRGTYTTIFTFLFVNLMIYNDIYYCYSI